MTDHQHPADPEEQSPTPTGPGAAGLLTPTEQARQALRITGAITVGGIVAAVLGFLGMAAVANADFPFVRLVGLLLLFLFVIGFVATIRGVVGVVQALRALAKAAD
ncbi:hypothetical protein GCM10027290_66610 [Micromonospora sonneratiae]|uniref:Holin-X, holin superfamily III n=1 Tax=Micromonospora sonneratiae TaxID=1184706 RepID=A0ABW3YLP9_9ACTN